MAKNKIIPWVDVTCCICGCMAEHSGYYYRGIIGDLEKDTKNWYIDTGGSYCPDCAIEEGLKDGNGKQLKED